MSAFHGFFSLGGLAGAAIGGLLIAAGLGGGTGAVLAACVGLAAVCVAGPALLQSFPAEHGGGLRRPSRAALALGLLALLCMVIEGALVDWSALLMRERTGVAPAAAALGYSTFSIAMAACRFAGDRLVQRFGSRAVTLAGGLAMFAGLLIASLSPWYPLSLFALGLVGVGAANVVPLIFAAAARIPGGHAGAGVATVATIGYAGFLFGPPVLGAVATATGVAAALGCLSAAGLVIAFAGGALSRR